MKLLNAAVASISLLASASAYPSEAGEAAQPITVTRSGSQPRQAGPAEYFTGSVRVDPLFQANAPSRTSGAYVTFQPGARSAWHTHPIGQILIVTAGSGRVQRWGGAIEEIHPGDVVRIPPGQKHWHGASPTSAMTHIAIQEHSNGKVVDWLEKVSDAQYGSATTGAPAAAIRAGQAQPTRAQALFGDISPKLAELTDNVLFGDVWARPGLSRRDRSLTTVSALIAMNRPDQLRSHLAIARENGVTQQELVELSRIWRSTPAGPAR